MAGSFFGRMKAMLGGKPPAPPFSPPVPAWRPSFAQPLERVAGRVAHYTGGRKDVCVFRHGTCVVLPDGLDNAAARAFALEVLARILHAHPDMRPSPMNDGNVMVTYNHPAVNVVLADVAREHWPEVEARHLEGLAKAEVLFTPLGPNIFDDVGKQALLGRAYMFMDAQAPEIARIERHG